MNEGSAYLIAMAEAVSSCRPHLFERTITSAYAAGVSREDLLAGVEIGRLLANVPSGVLAHAYATINDWRWIAGRRPERGQGLTTPGARRRLGPAGTGALSSA